MLSPVITAGGTVELLALKLLDPQLEAKDPTPSRVEDSTRGGAFD